MVNGQRPLPTAGYIFMLANSTMALASSSAMVSVTGMAQHCPDRPTSHPAGSAAPRGGAREHHRAERSSIDDVSDVIGAYRGD